MANNIAQIANRFLTLFRSEGTKETFESLVYLLEQLEKKEDPDPVEVRLVTSIYHFVEHIQELENNIHIYVRENIVLSGDKLDNLYNSKTPSGTSILFE